MRIFVVGMPGAGNLGDDLISAFLLRHIARKWPEAEIGILTHGQPIGFAYPQGPEIRPFLAPRRRGWEAYFKRQQAIKIFLEKTDLVLLGGGGLFQDSHSPFTTHKWLRYAYMAPRDRIAAAVGVGFGPFQHRFSRWYLRNTLGRLSTIQVRDVGSQKLLATLGYNSQLAPDIVLGSDIAWSVFGEYPAKSRNVLGCSIRPWPGQQAEQIVSLIAAVCQREGLRCALFVFEHAEPNNRSEYDYAEFLARRLQNMGIEATVYCYNHDPVDEFVEAFVSVSCAIASRYHANILWQKLGKPVIPLAYAPKVKRLYKERGAEAVPVEDIDVAQASTNFQRVALDRHYNIPDNLSTHETTKNLQNAELVVGMSSVAATAYGIARSVQWRARHIAQRRQIDDRVP